VIEHRSRVWTARFDRRYLAVAAIAVVWLVAIGAWHVTHARPVAVAAAFDLVVTSGGAAYLLGVRGRVLGAVIAGGMIAAKLVLGSVLIVAAVLELATVAIVAVRVKRARAAWRAARADRLRTALAAVVPRFVAELIATELLVVHAAFAGWRARPGAAFSVHRTSGWPLIAYVFAALTLIEAPVVHIALVAFGLHTVAWIASALALYGAIWLAGDANLYRRGGITLGDDALAIELGTHWRGAIAYRHIERVRLASGPAELDVAIGAANVVIELSEPVELVRIFGRRKAARSIALELDEPADFVAQLAAYARA
jgi:hypothetical protein